MEKEKKKVLKKATIIPAVIGLVLGMVIMFIICLCIKYGGVVKLIGGKDAIASLDGKTISTQDVYDRLKRMSGLNIVLNQIDRDIFKDIYQLTDDEEQEAKDSADYYIEYYGNLGYSEEEFLSANGLYDYEDLVEDIRISMKKTKYLYDYLEDKLEDGAVQKYYEENKDNIETYDSEHILIKISDTVAEADALALANEIITKLNEGKTFTEVVEEYGEQITYEKLGYNGKSSNLQQSYIDELVALKDGEYSQTPILTTYGYHVVHKIATSTFEELRETIIETLSEDLLAEDGNLTQKAIVEFRNEKNAEIFDKDLKEAYDEYCDSLYETETEE